MCFVRLQDFLVCIGKDMRVTCISLFSFVNFQFKQCNFKVLLQSILCKLSVCQMDQFNLMVFPKEKFDFKTIADYYEHNAHKYNTFSESLCC